MSYVPTRLVEHAWVSKPRCLSSFQATPLRNPPGAENLFDELGYFGIACTCGCSNFHVFGHPQEGDFFACPLQLQCTACNKAAVIFDIREHGHDAELGQDFHSTIGDGEAEPFRCSLCKDDRFEVIAGMSYQAGLLDDFSEESKRRIQDLFDWFYLEAKCCRCGLQQSVTDYECA